MSILDRAALTREHIERLMRGAAPGQKLSVDHAEFKAAYPNFECPPECVVRYEGETVIVAKAVCITEEDIVETAEVERRAAIMGTQAEVDRAAMIAAWDDMSELAKQRAMDESLCQQLRADRVTISPQQARAAAVRIRALSDQVRELSHERDGLQAKLEAAALGPVQDEAESCPLPPSDPDGQLTGMRYESCEPIHIGPQTNKEWQAALQSESLVVRSNKEPSTDLKWDANARQALHEDFALWAAGAPPEKPLPADAEQQFEEGFHDAVDSLNLKEPFAMHREITDHRLSPASNELTITVDDQPGSGGANHRYTINGGYTGPPSVSDPLAQRGAAYHQIRFQEGTIPEAGSNGVTEHALLAIVADRLRSFQAGPFSSRENSIALTKIEEAMLWLHKRTLDRQQRGVEGKHEA